ncbi:MAG: NUDIX hydrolase [Verrucomicrobia bacterium]|nr:NUDIX hydrolase [Verrucomicrobiota bacterium]
MAKEPRWISWARELQSIAQIGLNYAVSDYDRERYQRIGNLAVEIFAEYSDEEPAVIKGLFQLESGYSTPKVDVRGVVLKEEKMLFVRERSDDLWTLPGGWADVNDSPSEAVEKEILEESGYQAKAQRMLAVFDRAKQGNEPAFPFHVYKLFILCSLEGGHARATLETSDVRFFSQNEIPPLSMSRVTERQIGYCFEASRRSDSPCQFD